MQKRQKKKKRIIVIIRSRRRDEAAEEAGRGMDRREQTASDNNKSIHTKTHSRTASLDHSLARWYRKRDM